RVSWLKASALRLAPLPPDHAAGEQKDGWHQDEERESKQIDAVLRELELTVHRRPRLNRDQVLVLREPVQHVHAEVEITAVAEECVAQETAAADQRHALILVFHLPGESRRDDDRAWYIAALVITHFLVDVVDFQPSRLRNLHQASRVPIAVLLLDLDSAHHRENGVQIESLGDRMHA